MGSGVGIVAAVALAGIILSGCVATKTLNEVPSGGPQKDGRDDVVVVAVLDWQLNPYHWNYLASHMPQHKDADPSNDLPLWEDPATWLPGYVAPSTLSSYGPLNLTLTPDDPNAVPAQLYEKDREEWAKVQRTTTGEVHLRWIPGTKVVGFVSTVEGPAFAPTSHGLGASSVSVGNIHGTCPSCLLVFVNIPGAAGEQWVRNQPWIDVTTHSYEASTTGVARDNIRNCDTSLARTAVERGQQIFWAAGNGVENGFTIPQSTLVNCQKSPDWVVSVGAIHPTSRGSYIGHGKPVRVASVGSGYPSAGGATVTANSTFSGTSNATPVAAGLYAEALHRLRQMTADDARTQRDGIIIEGGPGCGEANPKCAFDDGRLTVHELREAYFRAAGPTGAYFHSALPAQSVGTTELELWTKGHGAFPGRLGDWEKQIQMIVDHATGAATEARSTDLDRWMVAYSWCVQKVWGAWGHGDWKTGQPLPAPDPAFPQRSWMASELCPTTVKTILQRT